MLIITVPHAKRLFEDNSYHWCDTSAAPVARALTKALSGRGVPTKLFLGDVSRYLADLNRASSRWTTKFRKRVRDEILGSEAESLWVLDLHSFPSDSPWRRYDVVLLDPSRESIAQDTVSLSARLERNGYRTAIIETDANDIAIESRELGAGSLSVEVSESLPKRHLREIARVISDHFSQQA